MPRFGNIIKSMSSPESDCFTFLGDDYDKAPRLFNQCKKIYNNRKQSIVDYQSILIFVRQLKMKFKECGEAVGYRLSTR